MNAEAKAKWVEALRSGKYKKTQGTLKAVNRTGARYCCLGVLCEISPQVEFMSPDGELIAVVEDGSMSNSIIPDGLAYSLGITRNPEIELSGEDYKMLREKGINTVRKPSLAFLNDQGLDFKTIAYLIEKYL